MFLSLFPLRICQVANCVLLWFLYANDLDVTVSFITSNLRWKNKFDLVLKKSNSNGLKVDSILKTSKIATLDKDLVAGKLGALSAYEISEMNEEMKKMLQLK